MDAFSAALLAGDSAAFLHAFSPHGTWQIINTNYEGQPSAPLSYERLARALADKDDLYVALFGERPERNLRWYVSGEYQAPWEDLGPMQFVPHGLKTGRVWIAWRPEGEHWYVDTIAAPLP